MQHPFRVSLWGMPGSGKSTLGIKISEYLKIPHFDLDLLFLREKKISPADWIEQLGEKSFRQQESQLLEQFINNMAPESFILSTGGGTPVFLHNRNILNQNTRSVYLYCPPDVLVRRIKNSSIKRPLLDRKDSTLEESLKKLLNERDPLYREAQFIFINDNELHEKIFREFLIVLSLSADR